MRKLPKIRKQYQKGFTTLDNTPLNDESLSWKAKGLFAYLWSKPDDWDYRVTEVARHATDGIGSTSTGVNELEQAGYLKRKQKNKNGVFGDSVWTLSEKPIFKKPITENPLSDNPITDKPYTENRLLLNTDELNTDLNNTNITTTTPTNFNNATTAQSGGSQKHSHEDVYDRWQKDWGFPNTFIREDLEKWLAAFGNDVVYYTIEYALSKDVKARNADSFLNTVFENYASKKILTVDDAKKVNAAFDSRNNNYQKGNYVPRKPKKRIYD